MQFYYVLLWFLFAKFVATVQIPHDPRGEEHVIAVNASKTKQLVFYTSTDNRNPFRVNVWMEDNLNTTVLVVIAQRTKVTSWQLPYYIPTSKSGVMGKYSNVSKILCYDSDESLLREGEFKHNFTIYVSTTSHKNINVTVYVENFSSFFLQGNKTYETQVSPSRPVYYSYDYPKHFNASTVTLKVHSEKEACVVVSIQQKLCPVEDFNYEEADQALFFTVRSKGGLKIWKHMFPNGFLLVFNVKADNQSCNTKKVPIVEAMFPGNKSVNLSFVMIDGRTEMEYIISTVILIFINIGCILLIGLGIHIWNKREKQVEEQARPVEGEINPGDEQAILLEGEIIPDEEQGNPGEEQENPGEEQGNPGEERGNPREEQGIPREVQANPMNNEKEHIWQYVCYTITAVGFYCMPVLDLMNFTKKSVFDSGNLDICYYNFLCSNPLFYFYDFNHLFSNVGYPLFGGMFIIVVWLNSKYIKNSPYCGIPRHYSLFYAMGLAEVVEGPLSFAYHVCPNQGNFQFDTSFMYVMVVLVIAKLYQNRHFDRMNEKSYMLFSLLAVIVCSVSLESFFSCDSSFCFVVHSIIIALFIFTHLGLFVYIGHRNYNCGQVYIQNNEGQLIPDVEGDGNVVARKEKIIKGKRRFAIFEVVVNTILLCCASLVYTSIMDFPTYVLLILGLNAILYCGYYMLMKICAGETIVKMAQFLGLISLIVWFSAGYFFFFNSVTKSSSTPAGSRELNEECYKGLIFYDSHDVWHLLSALALFLTFSFVLVLDDDLRFRSRTAGFYSF